MSTANKTEDAWSSTLKINEIFYSIQGESAYAGLPCVFIRLTYCNLRCTYCDTTYAFYEGIERTLKDILAEVEQHRCPLVEVTGGEPLLQKNVLPLLSALCDRGYEVLLETGGHMDIAPVDPRVKRVMDIKCPSSGESQKFFWPNLEQLRATDQIKFLIGDREDYLWAKQIIEEKKLSAICPLIISAVFGRLDYARLAGWVLEDHLPVRFQLPLHKFIWPHQSRGV